MKDIHSHFLPGVDDGSKYLETTISMLEKASLFGVTDIVFTPHYIEDSKYNSNIRNNKKIFNNIKKIAAKEFDINLYLGNEVFFATNILDLLKRKEITPINNTRYILIEIPMYNKITNIKEVFFELISSGYIPILAHPERYEAYYKEIDFFKSLKEMGVLFQLNYVSIIGSYGSHAKKMAKIFLKNGMIDLLGSDIHSDKESKYDNLNICLHKIKKIVGTDELVKISEENFTKVVNNDDIS